MSVDLEAELAELGARWSSSIRHVEPSEVFDRLDSSGDDDSSDADASVPSRVGPRNGTRARRWVLAGAAVCIVALVGGLIVDARRREREPEPAAAPVTAPDSAGRGDWVPSASRLSAVMSAETPWEINVGSFNGVHVGMPVVDGGGLVGRIASVTDDRSVVRPVTDDQFVVAAKVDQRELGASSALVALEGQGPGKPLQLRVIDPAGVSDFEVDDDVVTAGGAGSLAPADIPIGRISAELTSDGIGSQAELFEVTPYADLASVDSVTVLLYRPASAEPAADPTATVYVEGQPVDPVDLVDIPSDYDAVIDEALQVATRECMEAQGFSYIPNPAPAPFVRPPTVRDADYRQEYGFGQPPQPAEPDRREFMAQLDDPAWSAAWQGINGEGDGCSGKAIATVFPPDGAPSGPARDALTQAVNVWRRQIEPSSIFAEATADWATCMTEFGYSTTTPSELAMTMLADRPDEAAAGPSPSELSAALDDWSCQLSTGYVDRVYGYLQQSTEQFATSNASMLAATNAEYSASLDRARQIIAGN